MGKSIGILAIKGGVGKTTVSASLAASLVNHYDKKVLLIDGNYSAPNLGLHMDILEPEKTIHHALDKRIRFESAIHNKFGVDVIPGEYVYNKDLNYLVLKEKIKSIKEKYDFVVIDSSPSANDEILSTVMASDIIFIVTTPDYPTLSCTLKTAKLVRQRGRPIAGIIVNKIRNPRYEISLKEIENSTEIPVVASIPDDKHALRAAFTRIPMPLYKRNSKLSREIDKLSAAITQSNSNKSLLSFLFGVKKEDVNRNVLRESFYQEAFVH